MSGSNNIFVQILPVVKSPAKEKTAINGKILLCKWNQGDFKDRFTGLIRAVDFQDQEPSNNANFRVRLATDASSLLPEKIAQGNPNIELVAILNFTDPPAYVEYVYVAHLSENTAEIKDVTFDGNPCEWYEWQKIPFEEMPEDDRLWYPKVLQEGLKVTGSFTFGSWSEKTLKSYDINTVTQL